MTCRWLLFGLVLTIAAGPNLAWSADSEELSEAVKTVKAVGPKGEGNAAAGKAWQVLASANADQLTTVLAGMDGAGTLASNWFRAAVEAIAERELRNGTLPKAAIEKFLFETEHSPLARALAYEWIVKAEPEAPDRLLPKMLDDPSLELRRGAVSRLLNEAAEAKGEAALALYQKTLKHARDLDQVKTCTETLAKLKQPVDVATHLGFLTQWRVIAPFDNTNKSGFDVAYPPEKELNYDAVYQGKTGEVKWIEHETKDAYGIVDLAEIFNKEKGAVAYAAAEFNASEAREVQLRMGCINANKVWLNGDLLNGNEVYHAGMNVDQYIVSGQLKPGKNTILVKVCQNEQTESWAQRWQFQLRVSDHLGGAVLAQGRTPRKIEISEETPEKK